MLNEYKTLMAHMAQEFPLLGQAMVHHLNTRGQPMSFKQFPYLAQMYRDIPLLDYCCIQKGVQTGFSEFMILLALYEAGWQDRIVAYTQPTQKLRDRFVSNRINKILMNSEAYRELLPRGRDLGNNSLKQFGRGALLFLGSNTAGDFVEFSADTFIIDELDHCEEANIAKGRDRIRASDSPKMYELGNPSLPNIGISRKFDLSDQRLWHQKCPRCGHWLSLNWFDHFVEKTDTGTYKPRDPAIGQIDYQNITYFKQHIRPVCNACNKPFERRDTGEWIPTYLERVGNAGYRMTRLDVLKQKTDELFVEWIQAQDNLNKISTFYTSVMGVPYEHAGAKISSSMLADCTEKYDMLYFGAGLFKDKIVSMGVDVGTLLNVQISEQIVDKDGIPRRKTILVRTCRDFAELQTLMESFDVDTCVIDAQPETRKAQELRNWGINRGINVWLCRFYPTPKVGQQDYGMKQDWRTRTLTVDRTQIMDATFDEIRFQHHVYPEEVMRVIGWQDQMKAPVRVYDEEKGKIVWVEGSKADHYRFADVYDRLAFDLCSYQSTLSTV